MTTDTLEFPSATELTLHPYAESAYLQYAIATVKGRALAQAQDGLKPVQRRILYTMRQLGLSSSAKPVKSARVVGDVLGKYHPHGDQSVYDAMVRMAQGFTLRYPLILGQGNFGSRDGDSAAAMRYTEARLSPIAELMLQEVGQGTVDFTPNYDGTLQEPSLAPARLPFLLLNGTMGIAVGMAADIPPHNLREVVSAATLVMTNPQTNLADVLQVIGGPDFPEGGQLISTPSEIEAVYQNGRGSLRCRARWVKEDLARNQWQIVVTELPYQVSTKQILEQIDSLTNPQPPAGKKTITQQQANSKQLALDFLEKVVDESDKDNKIRLVFVPRSGKVDAEQMMAFLLANTSLEANTSVNMTVVGLDGRPQAKNLLQLIQEWVEFRLITVRRRLEWELELSAKRAHILQGRLTVFNNLEAVVKIIRDSDDPKQELQTAIGLSPVQAEDVLEMKLRSLNKLEGSKLQAELNSLETRIGEIQALLSDEMAIRKLTASEMQEDARKYGDDRRTLLAPQEKRATQAASFAPKVLDEAITVVLSKNHWVRAYKGHALSQEAFQFKTGDAVGHVVETSSAKTLWVLDSKGRAYSFEASLVPSIRGEGAPLSTFIELAAGTQAAALLSGTPDEHYVFAGSRGYGLKAPLKSLSTRQKVGKAFMVLEADETLLPPLKVPPEQRFLACESSERRLLVFDASEVKTLSSGGKGVQLMGLPDAGRLTRMWIPASPALVVTTPAQGKKKETRVEYIGDEWLKLVSKRARRGVVVADDAVIAAPVSSTELSEPGNAPE